MTNEAKRREESKFTDLLAVIGNEKAREPEYCSNHYWRWENHTAQPELEALGYEVCRWFDGERDSFSPLTRCCLAKKDGEIHRFIYG